MKVFCVTNRRLCRNDFLSQIESICRGGIDRIILREKDLSEYEYELLAEKVLKITQSCGVPLSVQNFPDIAMKLKCDLHLPYSVFCESSAVNVGVSVHSVQEALSLSDKKPLYMIAGHIFETDCKKGLAPRGTHFLSEICRAANAPVYAIGGINADNAFKIAETGAEGVCVMSSLMAADDPSSLIKSLKKNFLSDRI